MTTVTTIIVSLLVAAQSPAPAAPPQAAPGGTQEPPTKEAPVERPPPSLDEALGIGGAASPPAGQGQDEDLGRSLDGAKPRDILASAIEDMRKSARMLESNDVGIGTRRVQESVVRKLDELIASAQRMKDQQQGQSQGSQQKQQAGSRPQGGQRDNEGSPEGQREQGQPRGGQDPRRQEGNRRRPDGDANANEPPQAADPTTVDAQFDESRAEWGRLPPRVREAVRQGLRDPVSAAYRRLTQDYYRRLAEEPRR